MNKFWGTIIIGSIFYALITGRIDALSTAILDLPLKAFDLALTLVLSACFWTGFMYILQEIGAVKVVAKMLGPLMRKLFPKLHDQYAIECI